MRGGQARFGLRGAGYMLDQGAGEYPAGIFPMEGMMRGSGKS